MRKQLALFRPIYLLQAESFCTLVAACTAYSLLFPHHWGLFVCLFLVPDLSLLFVRGLGLTAAAVYNTAHSYVLPVVLGVLAIHARSFALGQVSLIWISHIGMDRTLGYGLKYPASFRYTHIQSAAEPSFGETLSSRAASAR